jgi:hypothetical protein
MWEPRRLTTLWACTASYRDRFTFTLPNAVNIVASPYARRFRYNYAHFQPKTTIFREDTVKFGISFPAFQGRKASQATSQQETSSKQNLLMMPTDYVPV